LNKKEAKVAKGKVFVGQTFCLCLLRFLLFKPLLYAVAGNLVFTRGFSNHEWILVGCGYAALRTSVSRERWNPTRFFYHPKDGFG
jgi:hypothetical protein